MVSGACKIIKMNTVEIGEMIVYQEMMIKASALKPFIEAQNLIPELLLFH